MPVRFLSSGRGDDSDPGPVTVPAGVYRDPARYRSEVADLLSCSWVLAGHGSKVTAERLLVWDGFGQSVVVCRDKDGALSAFHNVCQHRGARLAEDGGSCPDGRVVCPWHAFEYDRSGRVVSVPRRSSFDPRLLESLAAPAVAVAEFCGLVWINLAGDRADPLADELGSLVGELDAYEMASWYLVGERSWAVPANWKAVVEGFSEVYHARTVHDETIPSGLVYDQTQISLLGRHSMMVTPLKSVDYAALPEPVDHRAHAYCHYSAFPTTVLSCFPTHAQVMSMVPQAVDLTDLRVFVIARPEAPPGVEQARYESRMASGVDHFGAIASEDLGVLGRLSTSVTSFGYRANIYGRLESRISRFHRSIEDVLGPFRPRRPDQHEEEFNGDH